MSVTMPASNNTILPDYQQLHEVLQPCHPAETHGLLCGLLAVEKHLSSDHWLAYYQQLLYSEYHADELPDPIAISYLQDLYDATSAQLGDDQYSFQLLLPDDDLSLSYRADAVVFWCKGFLNGLGQAGLKKDYLQNEEISEFLTDVSEIVKAGMDAEDDSEDDEAAYAEIVEYLRIGSLVLEQELRSMHEHVYPDSQPTVLH